MQAGSLIISVFGDAVMPRGGGLWLGSLIRLLQPLEINERLIRTAIFRLVKEDWLHTRSHGRRADYFLSPTGQQRMAEASRHIYASADTPWDQRWRLILCTTELKAQQREALRRALFWQGFGSLNAHTFIHPSADLARAMDALLAEGLGALCPSLTAMLAAQAGFDVSAGSAEVVQRAWNLHSLADSYQQFVHTYTPLLDSVRKQVAQARESTALDDESAFLLRLLLLHDYRRLLLRDPNLPLALLPDQWPGQKARLLCKELYRRLLSGSERHLDAHLRLADGSAPQLLPGLAERFPLPDPLASASSVLTLNSSAMAIG